MTSFSFYSLECEAFANINTQGWLYWGDYSKDTIVSADITLTYYVHLILGNIVYSREPKIVELFKKILLVPVDGSDVVSFEYSYTSDIAFEEYIQRGWLHVNGV